MDRLMDGTETNIRDRGTAARPGALSGMAVAASTRGSQGWRVALMSSVVLHGVLLAWAVLHFSAPRAGARGVQLEGLEIEIISAAALDSLRRAALDTAGRAATVAEQDGPTVQPPPADAPAAATSAPPRQDLAVITAPAGEPQAGIAPPVPKDHAPTPPSPDAPRPEVSVQVAPGGAAAEGPLPADKPTTAAAGAAPGEVSRYAADVRRVLARSRPGRNWPAGRLRLTFVVSDAGRVARADVAEGSGNTKLDQLALAWIAATHFPAPPVGLTEIERTYAIPLTITGRRS